jgi:hypothetical protein
MILRDGMRVLVNASNIGHRPDRSYPITAVNRDTIFLEGWWDRIKSQPLHVPKDWIWPLLDPGERVLVSRIPGGQSPVANAHRNGTGIWTVEHVICHAFFPRLTDFSPIPPLAELPCVVRLLGVQGFFDPRFLDDPTSSTTSPDPSTLKAANTNPNAKLCAACGGSLRDPGMGPLYKHCPRCEP